MLVCKAKSKGVAMVTKVLCCCQSQQRRTVSLDGSLSGYMLLSSTAEEDNKSLCGPEWLHVGCSCQHESTISIYVSLSGYMLLSGTAERTISLYVGLSGYMLLSVAAEEDK